MQVKILKSSSQRYWYCDLIGKVYEVFGYDKE